MIASDRGFTLIEIMVSMAVLAIVLTSLFKLQSSTIVLSEAAHFKSIAPVMARQQLTILEQKNFNSDELSNDFDGEYKGYTSSCEVEDGTDAADWDDLLSEQIAGQLKKIQLTIYSPNQERSFSLMTWRYIDEE